MSRGKELMKNTAIIFAGTILSKAAVFILLPLCTSVLSTEEYGVYDLIFTIISLVFPIATFQIEQTVFRDLIDCRDDEEKKKKVISSALFFVFVQCAVCAILFLIMSPFINSQYSVYLLINIFASIFASLFLQISRGVGNNKLFAIGNFISTVVTVLCSAVFLLNFGMKVDGMLLGSFIGQAVCAIFLLFALKLPKYIFRKKAKVSVVRKMLAYSMPLVPNTLSWWVFSSSDRFIVSTLLGFSANGILAAASKISSIYTVLYNVFDRSWVESIIYHYHDKDIEQYFNKTFNMILKIFISLALLSISAMPFVYKIFINDKFIDGYWLVPMLLIAAFLNTVQGLIAAVYAAEKDTKSIAKTSIAAAIINIIVHLGLINFIGVYAAAISTICAYFIIAIYRYFDVRKKYLKIKIDGKMAIVSLVVLALIMALYYTNSSLSNVISLMISGMIAIIYNRHTLSFIKGIIMKKKGKI